MFSMEAPGYLYRSKIAIIIANVGGHVSAVKQEPKSLNSFPIVPADIGSPDLHGLQ